MKVFLSILLALCAFASLTIAQLPIPNRPDGYALSPAAPATAPVVLEAFFDVLCPDSKAAWPIVQQVLSTYPDTVYFLLHTFPLPYHTWAFIANEGVHVIDALTGGNLTAVRAYTDLLFNIQESYYNNNTLDLSPSDVYDKLASDVAELYADSGTFRKRLAASGGSNMETRISWKYGCSRGVAGTPTFLLNGVYISADASWSLSDWQSVINPILKAAAARSARAHRAWLAAEPVAAFSAVLSKVAHRVRDNETCPTGQTLCDYEPKKFECCTKGEDCIPNVGCRCLTDTC